MFWGRGAGSGCLACMQVPGKAQVNGFRPSSPRPMPKSTGCVLPTQQGLRYVAVLTQTRCLLHSAPRCPGFVAPRCPGFTAMPAASNCAQPRPPPSSRPSARRERRLVLARRAVPMQQRRVRGASLARHRRQGPSLAPSKCGSLSQVGEVKCSVPGARMQSAPWQSSAGQRSGQYSGFQPLPGMQHTSLLTLLCASVLTPLHNLAWLTYETAHPAALAGASVSRCQAPPPRAAQLLQ